MHSRQRRASGGLLCVVKEASSDALPSRGHLCPLLSYKTETGEAKIELYPAVMVQERSNINIDYLHTCSPLFSLLDHSLSNANEKNYHDTKEKCRVSRNGDKRCIWLSRQTAVEAVQLSSLIVYLPLQYHRCSERL